MRYDLIKIKQKLDADTHQKNHEELKKLKSNMTLAPDYLTPEDAQILVSNLEDIAKEFSQSPGDFLEIGSREVDDIKEFISVLKVHHKFAKDLKRAMEDTKVVKFKLYNLDKAQLEKIRSLVKTNEIDQIDAFEKYLRTQKRDLTHWINYTSHTHGRESTPPENGSPLTKVIWKLKRFKHDVKKSSNLSVENYDRIKLLEDKVRAYEVKNFKPEITGKPKTPLKRRPPKP